jgi:hypothetical protein
MIAGDWDGDGKVGFSDYQQLGLSFNKVLFSVEAPASASQPEMTPVGVTTQKPMSPKRPAPAKAVAKAPASTAKVATRTATTPKTPFASRAIRRRPDDVLTA